jgi:tetratricopeptide (TPR) repeat protein
MNIRTSAVKLAAGIALAIAGIVVPVRSSAQWVLLERDADETVRGGFDALYNLRYDEADTLFTDLARRNPDHPAGYFLLALVDWWRIVPNIDEDMRFKRHSESFNARLDKVIEISDARLEKNPGDIVGLFFKGAAIGYQARYKLLSASGTSAITQWPSAAFDGVEAMEILNRAQAIAPSNSDILLGSGLFMYMSAALPEQYPAAKPFLGFLPPGDRTIGLSMLRISAQKAKYASVEAKYALLEILSSFERNWPEVLTVARELNTAYPNNPIFHRYLAQGYYMTSDFASADSAYTQILHRVMARQNGYDMTMARRAMYFLGDIRMRTGKLESAANHLRKAVAEGARLDRNEETNWMALSRLKLGYVYDLMGKRKEAIEQYEEVLDMEEHPFEKKTTHAFAKEYLTKPYKR